MDDERKDQTNEPLKCEYCDSKKVERQAESGEWWIHCHSCGMDSSEEETEASKLKTGDVVCLKSGSPPMTVFKVFFRGKRLIANCLWFDASGLKHVSLPENVLEKADIEYKMVKGSVQKHPTTGAKNER